jgi:hypothetical protein
MLRHLSAGILVLALAGCSGGSSGGGGAAPNVPPLKTIAEAVSKTGQIGSGVAELDAAFASLEKSDPAKASSVKPVYDAMLKAEGKPEEVKKAAAELASKL